MPRLRNETTQRTAHQEKLDINRNSGQDTSTNSHREAERLVASEARADLRENRRKSNSNRRFTELERWTITSAETEPAIGFFFFSVISKSK